MPERGTRDAFVMHYVEWRARASISLFKTDKKPYHIKLRLLRCGSFHALVVFSHTEKRVYDKNGQDAASCNLSPQAT